MKCITKWDLYAVALFLAFCGLIIFGWYEVIYAVV